jgi:squalene-hopene/tetraprenyl-beta-curcumene cyclase
MTQSYLLVVQLTHGEKMKKSISIILTFLMCYSLNAGSGINESLLKEARVSVGRAVDYLLKTQKENGSWSELPAFTALITTSMLSSTEAKEPKVKKSIAKAEEFLLKHVNADGSIWKKSDKGYPNYSTSLASVAFYLINKNKHRHIIKNARKWLIKSQFGDETGIEAGGIGYGSDKTKSDLSNTQLALEALFITADIEDENTSLKEAQATKNCWNKANTFLSRCQALPTHNDLEWAQQSSKENRGSYIYSPDRSKADSKNGYGSMTYAGIKSMIYTGIITGDKLVKEDPRVKAALDWASRNYTLDENPGAGARGHFYYIQTFAKALHAYGEDTLKDKDGKVHMWRKDVVKKLLSIQNADGHWVNKEGSWMEKMPELVTAYCLSSMNYALAKDSK